MESQDLALLAVTLSLKIFVTSCLSLKSLIWITGNEQTPQSLTVFL